MKPLKLEELTLEQKIGQLIIVRGFVDQADRDYIMEMTEKKSVGGFQIGFSKDCRQLIEEINSRAGYPVLICANMEYGFAGTKYRFPAQMAIAATDDVDLAYKTAQITAIEAKSYGYNMIWTPVVDICGEGRLCKNTRCFGDNLEVINKFACAMIKGYQDEGMIVTAKHFPGGSDVKDDSHLRTITSQLSEKDLLELDMVPYLEIMEKVGLSGIMTSHNIFEKIDPGMPATLSKKVLDLIRSRGFDGLIQSDSFAMMSICQQFGEKECLGISVAAGCDQVLPNYRLTFKESYDALMEAYNKGVITPERLDEAVRRIIEAQEKVMKPASSPEPTPEHDAAIEELNRKSLIFIGKDGTKPALRKDSKKLFVLFCENEYDKEDMKETAELEEKDSFSRAKVEENKKLVLKEFPDAEVLIVNDYPNNIQNERVALAATKCDEAIYCTFSRPHSYQASDGVSTRAEYVINSNPDKLAVFFHTGNPYEIKKFPAAKRIFLGHLGGDSLKYMLKALKGEFEPVGKLPVTID